MARDWVIMVCIWWLYCGSPGLGEKPYGAHLTLALSGEELASSNNGHIVHRGHQLFNSYQSKMQTGNQKIIYTCTKSEVCGGLGDRFKGFVSTFILAVLLNAEFAIAWDTPFPIGDFYNSSAQVISEKDLLTCQNHTAWSWLNEHVHMEKLKYLRNTDFAREYNSSDCVTVHLNGAVWNHFILNNYLNTVASSYNLPFFSKREVFQMVMDIFFGDPMPHIRASVQQIHASLHGSFRIGVQMRFGGVWGDPQRYEGSSVENLVACFARKTLEVCLRMSRISECSVFITSDNTRGKTILRNILEMNGFHVFSSTEESVHVDERVSNPSMHNQIITFAEWETLRSMDRLVCSRSGFGETASWAGNVPAAILKSDLCCFTDEGVEVPEGADPHGPASSFTC